MAQSPDATPVSRSGGSGLALTVFLNGFLLLSFVLICRRLYHNVSYGGSAFKQGDWLINSLDVEIRRGLFGEALILASDAVGLSPLMGVFALQIALLTLLFIAFRVAVAAVPDPGAAILLTLSPAMFCVFWVADPEGALRKELIVFAGLTLSAISCLRGGRVLLLAGTGLIAVSFWAHEALILFIPVFVVLIWLRPVQEARDRLAIVSILLVLLSAALALGYALSHRSLQDTAAVCAPLLERGLEERICGGAIAWLARDLQYVSEALAGRISPVALFGFVLAYVLSVIPLIYLLRRTVHVRISGIAIVLAAVPFLPLYGLAVDWGRWMSFHVFSVTIVTIVLLGQKRLVLTHPIGARASLGFGALALLLSPDHIIGAVYGGFALNTAGFLGRFLSKIGGFGGL